MSEVGTPNLQVYLSAELSDSTDSFFINNSFTYLFSDLHSCNYIV